MSPKPPDTPSVNSSLRLEKLFYDVVDVEAVREYRPTSSLSLSGAISVEEAPLKGGPGQWLVGLSVKIDAPEGEPLPPYTCDLHAIGHFTYVSSEGDADSEVEGERIVGVNGATMLYTSMRELAAIITGRGPWGQMLLPTVDFRVIEIVVGEPVDVEDAGEPED